MMFDTALPSSGSSACPGAQSEIPDYVRDASELRASFNGAAPRTRLGEHYGHGSLQLRMLRARDACQAVLINTGGGIAGGDRLAHDFTVGPAAHVAITTQAAEKIYKAEHGPVTIGTRIRVAAGARLDWLPQETILFDRARLDRRLDIDLAADSTLTVLECIVLGRTAYGETVETGSLRDRWRIRRGDRLVLAEDVRLDGAIGEKMRRAAIGNGARAMATLIHVAPGAEARLDAVRGALDSAPGACAASAWNGCLVARFLCDDAATLRAQAARTAMIVTDSPMPRSWDC